MLFFVKSFLKFLNLLNFIFFYFISFLFSLITKKIKPFIWEEDNKTMSFICRKHDLIHYYMQKIILYI